MSLNRARPLVAALAVGLIAVVAPQIAGAQSITQTAVVSQDPANYTPNLLSDNTVSKPAVFALGELSGTMYAGGQIHSIQDSTRTTTSTVSNMFSFNETTGAVNPSFAPAFSGPVWAIQPYGSSLFVGGSFTSVNGIAHRGLVKIDAATGQTFDPQFNPTIITSGQVTEIRVVNGRLIIGGTFPKRLAALDPTTGADTGYINLGIKGSVASNAGPVEVYRFAVSPDNTRLVAIGNFTTVGGQTRYRAFMADLGTTSATLDAWNYLPLQRMCKASSLSDYLRDVDFSPDSKYFVIVSTGYVPLQTSQIGTSICDAAARFETTVPAPTKPTWINYTGGDTLHSVAITGAAVYVQGHMRWLDNPYGVDSCGTGCSSRPGIGALDPTTGHTFADWNPTKTRGVGGKDFLVTSTGLWVASDGKYFHKEYRWGIAFLPLPTQ